MFNQIRLAAHSLSVLCSSAVLMLEQGDKRTKLEQQQPNRLSNPTLHSPLPPLRVLRPNQHLEICYDARTRTPVYVQHKIVVDGRHKKAPKRPRFKEDTTVESQYRSQNSHYHSSGYDRGHQAPAADFIHSPDQFDDTFNLCNVAPQDSAMNRKIWANLEAWTRNVAEDEWKHNQAETFVTTGPLWLPRTKLKDRVFAYKVLGIGAPPALVQVPSHFFKVVVVVRNGSISKFACFVIPNEASANEKDLIDYVVPWTELEIVSGLTLYPGLTTKSIFKKQADQVSKQIQGARNQKLLTEGRLRGLVHLCQTRACRS